MGDENAKLKRLLAETVQGNATPTDRARKMLAPALSRGDQRRRKSRNAPRNFGLKPRANPANRAAAIERVG